MSERWTAGADPEEGGAASQEERWRALCAAADLPLKPSEGLQRQVAELAARHDAPAAQSSERRSRLAVRWGTAGAAAAAALIAVLGGLLTRGDLDRSREVSPPIKGTSPSTTAAGNRARNASESRQGSGAGTSWLHRRTPLEGGVSLAGPPVHAPAAAGALHQREAESDPSSVRARWFASLPGNAREGPESAPYPLGTLPGEEWDRLEQRVRREVQVRDDFVTIPFPRLVSVADHQIAAVVENYKQEAAVVDTRLAGEVTLASKATALSDLCKHLRAHTGIRLEAGRSVADEKVTAFCKKLPLREVMRQLSRPFGYAWLRSGKAGEYRYELVQDLRSQLLEEELRNRDRNEALLALDQEMNQYRRYLGLSPDEALEKAGTAPPEERRLLERYAGTGWGPAQIYFRLSPREIEQLRAGRQMMYSVGPGENQQPLPPEMARGALESMREERVRREGDLFLPTGGPDEGAPLTSLPGIRPIVTLNMRVNDLGQFTLAGGTGFNLSPTPGDGRHRMMLQELAVGISPAVRSPRNGVTNAHLARDPALQPPVTVALPGKEVQTVVVRGNEVATVAERKVTSADVLEAVHRATGMPLMADYYTRLYPVNTVTLKDRPLFEALNQLGDAMRLRWNKEGNWLQVRSASYFHDRLKEVPNRLLHRWSASRKENGGLTLNDILEIAALPDAQLDAERMAEGAREIHGLVEWDLARRGALRRHLRFLAQLTAARRQEALSGAGLRFTNLLLPQQQQFIAVAFGSDASRLRSLEELAQATLRVSYTRPGGFEWRPSGRPGSHLPSRPTSFEPSPAHSTSREAALQAALKIDARASEAQIVPTELAIMIEYSLGPDAPYRPAGIRVGPGYVMDSIWLAPKEPR